MRQEAAAARAGACAPTAISRRSFLKGTGAGAVGLALGLSSLRPAGRSAAGAIATEPSAVSYGGVEDLWRERWRWDRVVKGTHNRANCISACSWNLFVRDGIVWREEQNTIYEPSRPDVPDFNPRGCQKGACYSDLQVSSSRVLHPLKRAGPRGSGRWKRISWEQALDEIAERVVDAALEGGTESIVHDHGTTNIDFGPDTAGELRFAHVLGATILDSWAGVGDMPIGAVQTWGIYNCEGTADDWFRSKYILVWVGNPAYTRIPEVHFMHEARYRGARLVVVAPDYNATAVHADLWVAPRVETDAALALSMAHVIVAEGRHHAEYIREQTDLPVLVREDTGRLLRESDLRSGGSEDLVYFWDERRGRLSEAPGCEGHGGRSLALGGRRPALEGRFGVQLAGGRRVGVSPVFERLRRHLAEYEPERAREITGVAPAVVRRVAREMADADSAMIFASWGACKHYHSDLFQRAMILLMALTGNQGRPGGGLRVAAWWPVDGFDRVSAAEPHLGWRERLGMLSRAVRGLTPRDYEQFYTRFTRKRTVVPLIPFLHVHGGYDRLWSRSEASDPTLPRTLDSYVRDALENGWIPMHPAPGHRPRVFFFTGSNPLRRWPAPQIAREVLWPKLDCIVAVNFRMSTSAAWADYVLPAAAYYEKDTLKYAQTYVPYLIVGEKAVEPLGEARAEWEVFGRLAQRVQMRARARGVSQVPGPHGRPLDLACVYDEWSRGGRYDPSDPRAALGRILEETPIIRRVGLEEAFQRGAIRIVKPGIVTLLHQTCSDYDPKDTYTPHRWFVEKKIAWPTLSGRQQFYLDHDWFVEGGEVLPVHKDPPGARSDLPLRMMGGHTRWSIHAIWRDHELMLRLQRGEPVCFLSPHDAAGRRIRDGQRVRIRNAIGAFEVQVKVAPGVQDGEVIVYHAWEPYQFPGWKGQQEPVASPWKALHLAGGYGQIHYRMYYAAPGHAPRGTPVEVEPL